MSDKDKALLSKIKNHLYKLHKSWQSNGVGHHKSNEGYVGLQLAYPNWFEAVDYINDEPEVYDVEVYSYLFGHSRLHHFDSLEEAWEEVMTWKYEVFDDKE